MTQEEIIEGNKLIAEFMGCVGKNIWCANEEVFRYGFSNTHITDMWHESQFYEMTPYHTSWDWLMPCVEKIESLSYDVRILRYGSESEYTLCDIMTGQDEVVCNSCVSKIESVYKSVIEFIKWYNQNQKS